jgi:pterin-4a-carbinolamine dehydratase
MSQTLTVPDGWKAVARPPSLFRRFEFASYAQTRAFLDRLAELSQQTGLYPDLGFSTTHVNVTLHGEAGAAPDQCCIAYAERASVLAQPATS